MKSSLADFVCTDLVTIEADASIAALEARLNRPIDYGVPVLGSRGTLRGVIMPTDLLRISMQMGTDAREIAVDEVCRRSRTQLQANSSLRRARRLMLTRDLDSIIVLDERHRLAGMIFREDLERRGLLPKRGARWKRPTTQPRRHQRIMEPAEKQATLH